MSSDDNNTASLPPSYADGNETDIQAKQDSPAESTATDDTDVDSDDVQVLPGTGGPDDVGDIDVDPGELNLSGH